MDDYTTKHFETWLENEWPNEDDRDRAREAMLWIYDTDPDYYNEKGWPYLAVVAQAYEYAREE